MASLRLQPLNGTFDPKTIRFNGSEAIALGRVMNDVTAATSANGRFDNHTLSREHAQVWAESGKVWVRDVGSSNGTFVNGQRLSLEGAKSDAHELRTDDVLELGRDLDSGHRKISAKVNLAA